MSLNKKYTWNDFLKAHPEHKEKKTKRTSKEGQKAFEAACKAFNKEYLKERLTKIDKEQEFASNKREKLMKGLKTVEDKAKVSSFDARIHRLNKERESAKSLQKNL